MNSTYSACSTLYIRYAYSACLLYTSYVCLSSAQLSSTCLRESFAPSTVYVLLLHVTTISTVHLQPACSLHSHLRLQHVHTLHVPLYYSTCLRESFAPSTVYLLLLHATMISTVHLQPACSLLQRPVIGLCKVETNARLHFTHQTETSIYFYSYILRTFSPFSYSYISRTFS